MEQPKARLTLQQHQQAINEAIWIDASPHEWPTVDKMWLLCSALIDSVQMVDYLRSRLAAVEAERDAARAASEKDREWVGRALEKQAEYLGQSQMLVAERDAARAEAASEKSLHDKTIAERNTAEAHLRDCRARCERMKTMEGLSLDECAARQLFAEQQRDTAQAGEARAVELCVKASKVIRWCLESITHIDPIGGMEGFPDEFGGVGYDCEVIGESSSALDWLAQQRLEAVAAWIEKEATKCRQQNGEYYERSVEGMLEEAAALRAGEVGDE